MTAPNPNAPDFQEGYKAGFHEGLEEARKQAQAKKPDAPGKDAKKEEKESSPAQQKLKGFIHDRTAQIVAAIVVVCVIGYFIYQAMRHETTDDAYTAGHIHNISSRVTGTVLEVKVDDNQTVKQGDVLVVLDPTDYQVQVDQAEADYEKAVADLQRAMALQGHGAVSQQDIDADKATAGVAEAKLKDAKDQLEYCVIRAPADGRVGHKTVESGNRVNVGAALMAISEDVWVVANYKETQLAKMRPGQTAEISIDAIPDKKFKGYLDSWAPGSGATFALLPPDNATGNFTKIVQRVPVKIRFDPDSIRGYENRIVPGLSCEPSVLLEGGEANRSAPLQPQAESIPISASR
jgi:membrane fusion protein (multidrug efflux system)